MRKILICGGRDYSDKKNAFSVFEDSQIINGDLIIQGGASGGDYLARCFAKKYGIGCCTMHVNWDFYGKKAGPIRNSAMLSLNPDLCIALPGGIGTKNMVNKCKKAGIRVIEV